MGNDQESKEVIVTLAIGQKYLDNFNKTFRESFEKFAKKINAELVVVDQFIKKPSEKIAPWQKLLIFDQPQVSKYERALFMDGDIYITSHAKNPFEEVGEKPWGIVKNNPYNLSHPYATAMDLYKYCPTENRPDFMLNSGVFVISKGYKGMMEMIYEKYPEQHCCDNGPLSYHLATEGRGVYLPAEFNTVVYLYRMAHGYGLSTILKMYKETSFIHFAGNKGLIFLPLIKHIDHRKDSVLSRTIYFLGSEKFDFITARIIKAAEYLYGAYNYHVKKRFSRFFSKR